jgi:hypothetical protein
MLFEAANHCQSYDVAHISKRSWLVSRVASCHCYKSTPNEPDIPVMEPTRFQLVINLMKVPPTLLARADEVLE